MRPVAWITLAAVACLSSAAHARGDRFLAEPPEVEKTPAYRYAAMSSDACLAELRARAVPFERIDPPPPPPRGMPKPFYPHGVETPLRLTGPVRGITFAPTYRTQRDVRGPYTIADCRLALALDDLAAVLRPLGVVEVEYLSMYRRGWMKPGRRHPGGRAIDVALVRFADGTSYSVLHDFHGRPGAQTCGDKAASPTKDTPGARFWRQVVCTMDEKKSFNLVLSPHYDWGHRDHLHMEVRSDIRWFLIH
jgi:hypothetical protein